MPIKHPRFVSILFVAILLAGLFLFITTPAVPRTGEPPAPPGPPAAVGGGPLPVAIRTGGHPDAREKLPGDGMAPGHAPRRKTRRGRLTAVAVAANNESTDANS